MKKMGLILALFLFLIMSGCAESTEGLVVSKLAGGDIIISDDISLAVTPIGGSEFEVVLTNHSEKTMDHGHTIVVEKRIKGTWYGIPETVGYADESLLLPPGETFTAMVDLSNWPKTKSGTFRIYKALSEPDKGFYESAVYSVSDEFEIKK